LRLKTKIVPTVQK